MSAHDTVRAFFAVDLPPELQEWLAQASRSLRRVAPEGVRWVPDTHVHLTLKFLGDVPTDRLPKLIAGAQARLGGIQRFEIRFGGFGAFPNARAARILWLGVVEGAGALARVARKLESAASKVDIPRERRRFSPHLTLGRLRRPAHVPIERIELPEEFTLSLPLSVEDVVLYESRLSSAGSEYLPLARLPLRDGAFDATEFAPEI